MKKETVSDPEWRKEFANRLKLSLDRNRMNATELSRKTGIGKSDISNYMSGNYMPKQDRVYLIASALSVDPVWLYALDMKYTGAKYTGDEVREIVESHDGRDAVTQHSPESRILDMYDRLSPDNRIRLEAYLAGLLDTQQRP